MISRAHKQLSLELFEDSNCEVGRGGIIHWDGDHAAMSAAKKCRDPRGGVGAPENDAVASANVADGQLPGKAQCHFCYGAVGMPDNAISALLGIERLLAKPEKFLQITGDTNGHEIKRKSSGVEGYEGHSRGSSRPTYNPAA